MHVRGVKNDKVLLLRPVAVLPQERRQSVEHGLFVLLDDGLQRVFRPYLHRELPSLDGSHHGSHLKSNLLVLQVAVVDQELAGLGKLFPVTQQKGSVFHWIEPKEIDHHHRVRADPLLNLPAGTAAESYAFLVSCLLGKSQPISLRFVSNEVGHSLQLFVAGHQVHSAIVFLREEHGQEQALRVGLLVTESDDLELLQNLRNLSCKGKDGGGGGRVVEQVGEGRGGSGGLL